MPTVLLFTLAILALVALATMRLLLQLRLRFLKWIHWNWAVRELEQHFERWVLFGRVVLFGLAIVLFFLAVTSTF
tara:strand:+ start:494 stop:718 length:225 start_codon:yes stop_codon:yes gene_type:complete